MQERCEAGDPLSPLLFVLAADLLQSIANKAKDLGLLNPPVPIQYSSDFSILQYADDTLIILEGCGRQFFVLKALLNSFAASTGLKVNFQKSMLVSINLSSEKLKHLALTFGCSMGSLPFTYLGLPLGTTKPKIDDYLPLISRCEKRLVSTSLFLSQAGRLQITNLVFTALPTFFMSTFALQGTMVEQVNKYRKNYLWRGADNTNRVNSKAAWPLLTKSKDLGGLGVLDINPE